MMPPKIVRLAVERLESRCVPAGWPILPSDQVHPLIATYGQFGSVKDLLLHTGIDIPATKDTRVFALEDGRVVNAKDSTNLLDPEGFYSLITVKSGDHGWAFAHIKLGNAANLPQGTPPHT